MTQNIRPIHTVLSPKLLREARTREKDAKWLSSAPSLVLRKYRGKYVAVKNRKILAASPTMRGLYAKLDKIDRGMVLMTRIEKSTPLVYGILH